MNTLTNIEKARIIYARLGSYAVPHWIEKCEKEDTPDNREMKAITEAIEVGLIDTAVNAYLKENKIETITEVEPLVHCSGTHTCRICNDTGYMLVVQVAYNLIGTTALHKALVCRRCFTQIAELETK